MTKTNMESKILVKDIRHYNLKFKLIDQPLNNFSKMRLLWKTNLKQLEEVDLERTWETIWRREKERQLMINIKNIWTRRTRKIDPKVGEEELVKKILLRKFKMKNINLKTIKLAKVPMKLKIKVN